MKKFLTILASSFIIFFAAAPATALLTPVSVSAADDTRNCEQGFLGIPPWYRGLTDPANDCNLIGPDANDPDGLSKYIWRIVLNAIEIGLTIAAYVAIFFIIYGGFLFMTGGGNPAQVEKGRKSVMNAIVGLVISMGAIAITKFIFGIIGSAAQDANGVVQLTGEQLLQNGLNITYFIGGVISVIVIVIAGIMYTTSAGDTSKVTKAKNMLVYSIAGLVVVLVAFAITNFVIGRFS